MRKPGFLPHKVRLPAAESRTFSGRKYGFLNVFVLSWLRGGFGTFIEMWRGLHIYALGREYAVCMFMKRF